MSNERMQRTYSAKEEVCNGEECRAASSTLGNLHGVVLELCRAVTSGDDLRAVVALQEDVEEAIVRQPATIAATRV